MISLLPGGFAADDNLYEEDLSDFELSAVSLTRELLWLFWADAIDACAQMVDGTSRLIGPEDPYEFSGPAQITRVLQSMRDGYASRLIMRDEHYDVVSLGRDACMVLSQLGIEESSSEGPLQRRPASVKRFHCTTVWSWDKGGECKLALWSWRGFTSLPRIEERLSERARTTSSPIGTLRGTDDPAQRQPALQARGTDGVTHWIQPDSIIYVAAAHQYTDIYCTDRRLRLRASIASIADQLNSVVVRVHRSYAVNPAYISRFEQDSLYLTTGAVIPIPAKRLREVRLALQEHFNKLGKRD